MGVWYFTDFGDSWEKTVDVSLANQQLREVVTDSSGKYVAAVSSDNGGFTCALYGSCDFGQTWEAAIFNIV